MVTPWYTPVIPITWEAEAERLKIQGRLDNLVGIHLKIKDQKRKGERCRV